MFPTTARHGTTTALVDGPQEAFWDKYNKRLEFPLSTIAAVLLHVLIGAVIVFGIFRLMSTGPERASVALQPADISGLDDGGQGAINSGGEPEPVIHRNDGGVPVQSAVPVEPTPLPEIKEIIRKRIEVIDPEGKMPISDSRVKEYADLHKIPSRQVLRFSAWLRSGRPPGWCRGRLDSRPQSPLGAPLQGPERPRLRRTAEVAGSGRRLPATGGRLATHLLQPRQLDPRRARDGAPADDTFQTVLAGKIRFSDARRDAVQGVAGAVGLDFTPRTFWAFFPKELEDKLARLETGYRNKRSDDIEETIFRVTMRGGSYDVIVDEQRMKR